eukprot:1915444-Amphidinium_carterae.1
MIKNKTQCRMYEESQVTKLPSYSLARSHFGKFVRLAVAMLDHTLRFQAFLQPRLGHVTTVSTANYCSSGFDSEPEFARSRTVHMKKSSGNVCACAFCQVSGFGSQLQDRRNR